MAAMVLFGVPPEYYCPYVIEDFDIEPTAFLYSYAQNFQTIQYYRLDTPGLDRKNLLTNMKSHIAHKIPILFGFSVYSSYTQGADDGKIPFPSPNESRVGGHAVLAVGYDDTLEIVNKSSNEKTKGAVLVRNSWGEGWGEKGYGWLPYKYVLEYLAIDWWSLIKAEWVDSGKFNLNE
jgi:C1A family cysteine protease